MRIAELFAELGFTVKGAQELKGFEESLKSIAASATTAVAALKSLSGLQLPKGFTRVIRAAAGGGGAAGAAGAARAGQPGFIGPVQGPTPAQRPPAPGMLNFIGPVQPAAALASPPNALWQGIKRVLGITVLAAALRKLVSALGNWAKSTMSAAVNTELFKRQTGISRKTLAEWDLAAKKAGLAEGEAAQAFTSMAQKRAAAFMTGEGVGVFQKLIGYVPEDTEELFRIFRERTKNLTNEEAVWWGTMLGFTADWAAFVHEQDVRLKDLGALILTDTEQKKVTDLNAAWQELTVSMGLLSQKIIADVGPALTSMLKWLTDIVTSFTVNKSAGETGRFSASNFSQFATPAGATKAAGNVLNFQTTINMRSSGDPQRDGAAAAKSFQYELRNASFGGWSPSLPTAQ